MPKKRYKEEPREVKDYGVILIRYEGEPFSQKRQNCQPPEYAGSKLLSDKSEKSDRENEATVVGHLVVVEKFRMVAQCVQDSFEWLNQRLHPAHTKLTSCL